MKTKDLMMGDWIQSPIIPKPLKVAQINWDYSVECVGIDDMIRYHVGLGDIKPIPLTPEILNKNGFDLGVGGMFFYEEDPENKKQEHIWVNFGNDVNPRRVEINNTNKANCIFKNILFVHELQHALRLCEIEKEIQL